MKRSLKRFFALFLASALLLPLAGCGGESLVPELTEEPLSTVSPAPAKPAPTTTVKRDYHMETHTIGELAGGIRLLGERTNITEAGLIAEWACSGFEMTIDTEGTNLKITVDSTYSAYFKTYVDGEAQSFRAFAGEGNGQELTAARDIPAGTHVIRVVKDSGANRNGGSCTLTAVSFDGKVVPMDQTPGDLYLEFIGDSIWNGSGALGTQGSSPTYSEEISSTVATPYRTAMALGADYNVTAQGGIGVVKDMGGLTAGDLFLRQNSYRDETPYVPRRAPAAVIINLSTNDPTGQPEEFVERGKALVEEVYAAYGRDVKIVWVHSMFFRNKFAEEIRSIADSFGGEEAGFYVLEMIHGQNGSGSKETNRHPSSSDHEKNAARLVPFLQDLLKLG